MPFALSIDAQIAIATELLPDLEHLGGGVCQARCPGADCHSTATGKRDFRIWFYENGSPHDHCVHKSCAAARDALMRDLYRRLSAACPKHRANAREYHKALASYAHAPTTRPAPPEPYNADLANATADMNPEPVIDDAWLLAHSPTPIPSDTTAWPHLMLETLYQPGDRILIYTKFTSQGQVLHTVGGDTLRLEERPPAYGQTSPQRPKTGYPRGGKNGVWFQTAPVTGDWAPNPNNRDKNGRPRMGRRHSACCTRYPYLVLESDDAPAAVWLRILTQLRDPIAAIYTSGGKSYHALIRVNCRTKEEFDIHRRHYITRLAALGADPAAITAVRLSRLPGALRYGSGEGDAWTPYLDKDGKEAPRMQRLLFLNPNPQPQPLIPALRASSQEQH